MVYMAVLRFAEQSQDLNRCSVTLLNLPKIGTSTLRGCLGKQKPKAFIPARVVQSKVVIFARKFVLIYGIEPLLSPAPQQCTK